MKAMFFLMGLVLLAVLALAGCSSDARVGELRSESQSVEQAGAGAGANPVHVEIDFGAGNLQLAGGAEKLLESDFTYNVAKLKPVVGYKGGTLVVRQPETKGMPVLQNIADFRNEWDLRLSNDVPMDLLVDVGGGTSNLELAGLALNRLDVKMGAGTSTIDLSNEWKRDLDVSIDTGAAGVTLLLPSDVGVRVEVDRGPTIIDAPGLAQDGNVYTNEAYGSSDVTLHINIKTGIGWLTLALADNG